MGKLTFTQVCFKIRNLSRGLGFWQKLWLFYLHSEIFERWNKQGSGPNVVTSEKSGGPQKECQNVFF